MPNRNWCVHVRSTLSWRGPAGTALTLESGEYIMREVDLVSYDIELALENVRLGFSEVLRMERSGMIRIDGVFP